MSADLKVALTAEEAMRMPGEESRNGKCLHLAQALLNDQVIDRDQARGGEAQGSKHQVDAVQAKRKVLPLSLERSVLSGWAHFR